VCVEIVYTQMSFSSSHNAGQFQDGHIFYVKIGIPETITKFLWNLNSHDVDIPDITVLFKTFNIISTFCCFRHITSLWKIALGFMSLVPVGIMNRNILSVLVLRVYPPPMRMHENAGRVIIQMLIKSDRDMILTDQGFHLKEK